jgi:phage N-6-adenine-methyltransferase
MNKVHFSSEKSDWETPQDFFDRMNEKWGPFDLDVCASDENAKCINYITPEKVLLQYKGVEGLYEGNGLDTHWWALLDKPTCWMNPPYGNPKHLCKNPCNKKRCKKEGCTAVYVPGIEDWIKKAYDESQKGCRVVCLLPARTDTRWFHNYCTKGQIEFIKGRLKFVGAKDAAPFPSMVVVFESGK